MFVDSSAIVAIMTEEPGAVGLVDRLDRSRAPVTSALAMFQATQAVPRKKAQPIATSLDQVRRFLDTSGIEIVEIADAEGEAALLAAERFGRGTGHPARLTIGELRPCMRPHARRASSVRRRRPSTDGHPVRAPDEALRPRA